MSAARSPITTHVLDISLGKPAEGVHISLSKLHGDHWHELAGGDTDADGRVGNLLQPGELKPGTYRMHFGVADYFKASARKSFYPYADVVFVIEAVNEHYHVPLLLSPYGYSTYRGS